MGYPVLVIGESGTGKSTSVRTMNVDNTIIINVQSKPLPFRDGKRFKTVGVDETAKIKVALDKASKNPEVKNIIIDDFQYVMANEFMRRSLEKGFDKFTEIGKNAWSIVNKIKELPEDVVVFILSHEETDQFGKTKIKTIGKLLDEKITLEGMFSVVLRSRFSDGEYVFSTQNSGSDTVKSPMGMFTDQTIDNDLNYVCECIRDYAEIQLSQDVKPPEPEVVAPAPEKKEEKTTQLKMDDSAVGSGFKPILEPDSEYLTWDDLAEYYKKTTGKSALTLKMDDVFDWAKAKSDVFGFNEEVGTLYYIQQESQEVAPEPKPKEVAPDKNAGSTGKEYQVGFIINALDGEKEAYEFLRGVKTLRGKETLNVFI